MNKIFLLLMVSVLLTACAVNNPVINQPAPTEVSVMETEPTMTDMPTSTPMVLPTDVPPAALPTARLSPTAWPSPTSGPTPTGGSEQIVFGLSTRQAENYEGAGVFLFNFLSEQLIQIFEAGYRLQSISPDGRWLLVNQDKQLFLSGLLGDSLVLLSDKLVVNAGVTAMWTADGENILWIESQGAVNQLVVANALGENQQVAQPGLEHQPVMLFPSENLTEIVWKAGVCGDLTFCGSGVWVSDLTLQGSVHFETITLPNFASMATEYALALVQDQEQITLEVLSQPSLESFQVLDISDDYPTAFTFSGDGSRAAVLGQVRSDYSGKNFGNRIVLFKADEWKPQQLGSVDGLNGMLAWSPDDQHLAVMTTNVDDAGYRIELIRQNAASIANQVYTETLAIQNEAFIFVSGLKWVP